ncbi:MAG TPA: hypothetical protein VFR53_05960 [Methylomirabilota bacterium]|nr:hypothetical protein [Methylomirabilota bacterium]
MTHVLSTTQVQVVVSLTAFGFAPRPGTAVLIEQSTGERVRRAFAGLGMFWALALGGLFIPVAHFTCPRCGAQQTFKAGGRFEPDRSLDCPACHGTFALALPERAS